MSGPGVTTSGGGGFDNFIAGALFLAFVIYITAKGELPAYLQLFLYTPPGSAAASAPAPGSAVIGAPSSASALGSQPGNTYAGFAQYWAGPLLDALKSFGVGTSESQTGGAK